LPNENLRILSNYYGELSSRYKFEFNANNYDSAQKYLDLATKLISNTSEEEYSLGKKILAGDMATTGLMDYITNGNGLHTATQTLELINTAKFIDLKRTLNETLGSIFSKAMQAKNNEESEIVDRCIECLRLIEPYLPEGNIIDGYIQAIR
jgi:hypothetical protein